MIDGPRGIYLPGDTANVYVSTEHANAGWYEEGQHGGAVAALIAGHIEQHVPTLAPMQMNRLTVEIFRVIPLVPLRIETEVVREGKRIQTVQAHVYDPTNVLLSIATMQRLRTTDLPLPDIAEPPRLEFPKPLDLEPRSTVAWGVGETGKVMFHRSAIEIREIFGGFDDKGPGAMWARLVMPIVAGTETTPLQRAVAIGDFCNGISRALGRGWLFMNPDLTIHLTRYPDGDWIALSAESAYGTLGRGVATGTLWDTTGFLGRSTQSLYLDRIGD
jgi:Acyl-CoA thioesterase C-terminal domain/Acyl-CoA thioesterase N-terminal domain